MFGSILYYFSQGYDYFVFFNFSLEIFNRGLIFYLSCRSNNYFCSIVTPFSIKFHSTWYILLFKSLLYPQQKEQYRKKNPLYQFCSILFWHSIFLGFVLVSIILRCVFWQCVLVYSNLCDLLVFICINFVSKEC